MCKIVEGKHLNIYPNESQAKIEEEEEESKDLLDLRVKVQDEAAAKSEEDLERERQRHLSKQEKQFDAELQDLIRESLQENAQSVTQSKPVKLIREKPENEKEDSAPEPQNGFFFFSQELILLEKKITLCLRVGNKIVPKSIFLKKETTLAQKITEKQQEEEVIKNGIIKIILGNNAKSS